MTDGAYHGVEEIIMNYKKERSDAENRRIGITLIDVLIFVIIALVAVLAYRFVFTDTETEEYDVSYVIKVTEVRAEFSDRIAAGDEVYSYDGVYMGTVRACEVASAVSALTGQTIPGMYDLYVTVEAESADADEIVISGSTIKVEGKYSFRTVNFAFEGVCIDTGK